MNDEKYFQQYPCADDLWVIDQLDHFVVACAPITDLLIGGVEGVAIGIARFNIQDTFDLHKDGLGAPEAPTAQNQRFSMRRNLHGCILAQISP